MQRNDCYQTLQGSTTVPLDYDTFESTGFTDWHHLLIRGGGHGVGGVGVVGGGGGGAFDEKGGIWILGGVPQKGGKGG